MQPKKERSKAKKTWRGELLTVSEICFWNLSPIFEGVDGGRSQLIDVVGLPPCWWLRLRLSFISFLRSIILWYCNIVILWYCNICALFPFHLVELSCSNSKNLPSKFGHLSNNVTTMSQLLATWATMSVQNQNQCQNQQSGYNQFTISKMSDQNERSAKNQRRISNQLKINFDQLRISQSCSSWSTD